LRSCRTARRAHGAVRPQISYTRMVLLTQLGPRSERFFDYAWLSVETRRLTSLRSSRTCSARPNPPPSGCVQRRSVAWAMAGAGSNWHNLGPPAFAAGQPRRLPAPTRALHLAKAVGRGAEGAEADSQISNQDVRHHKSSIPARNSRGPFGPGNWSQIGPSSGSIVSSNVRKRQHCRSTSTTFTIADRMSSVGSHRMR
jgi:hypothetical protein